MNKIYRLIWSSVKERWVIVSEKVLSKGYIPASTVDVICVASLLLASAGTFHALPSGGQLVAGQAAISQLQDR